MTWRQLYQNKDDRVVYLGPTRRKRSLISLLTRQLVFRKWDVMRESLLGNNRKSTLSLWHGMEVELTVWTGAHLLNATDKVYLRWERTSREWMACSCFATFESAHSLIAFFENGLLFSNSTLIPQKRDSSPPKRIAYIICEMGLVYPSFLRMNRLVGG